MTADGIVASTLAEWLLERIAEDEAGARISPREWWSKRLLAECAAKRAILALHESWPVLATTPPDFDIRDEGLDSMNMRISQRMAWLTTQEYRARFGDDPPTTPTLRALASVYAGAEGWREEWAL